MIKNINDAGLDFSVTKLVEKLFEGRGGGSSHEEQKM